MTTEEIETILGHIKVYGVACVSEHDGHDPEGTADYWLEWLRLRLQQHSAEDALAALSLDGVQAALHSAECASPNHRGAVRTHCATYAPRVYAALLESER